MLKSQHILTGVNEKKAARARADETAERQRQGLISRRKGHSPTGRTPGPRSRETGACGKRKADAAACKASRLGWEGTGLRCGFLNSGDFWNQANVPHA